VNEHDFERRPGGGQRIAALDALRGVAIIAVFCHHAAPPTTPGGIRQVTLGTLHLGWAGVDLFFVLSGFLITGILLDSRERPDYFRRFYTRRFRRIFPLYYLALGIIIVVLPLLDGQVLRESFYVARSQAWYWTYASNIKVALRMRWGAAYADHFWTLAVEEQFYFVWPFVVLVTTPRTLLRVCGWIAALALIGRCTLVLDGWSPLSVTVFTLTRADSLALGAVPACLLRLPDGERIVRALIPRAALLGGGVAAVIAAADVAGLVGPWWAGGGGWWASVGYSALGLLFAAITAACVLRPAPRHPGAAFRFLRLTGTYSYGLYVIHAPVLYVLRDLGWRPTDYAGQLTYALSAGALSYAVAAASWRWLESRILGQQARAAQPNANLAAVTTP